VIAGLSHGGLPDAVFTQQFSVAPIVFHNQGDGSFRYLGTVIAGNLGGGPVQTVAAGDVNGDGNADLVEISPQGVWVILGSGGTGFALLTNNYASRQPQASYPSPAFVLPGYAVPEVALSDFDGDRKLDLASCYFVYPGKGDGTFGGPIYFGQMYDTMRIRPAIVEDVNGDGKLDIIGIGPDGQSVSVLINSSGAPVASAPAYLAGTGDVVVAPGALATIFGSGLSATTASFTSDPLPTTIGNTSVEIVDLAGSTFRAPLLYVSPTQINFQVPEDAAEGLAIINVTGTGRPRGAHSTYVQSVASALFTLDGTGKGAPVSSAVSVNASGGQTSIPTVSCAPGGSCTGLPLPLEASGQVYLSLYGTGFRHASKAECNVGGLNLIPTYFGPQGPGALIDQVNIPIPANTPKGSVNISCQFTGTNSYNFGNVNTVTIVVE
jgi:uncharacterized protein (TIGR03437 family)